MRLHRSPLIALTVLAGSLAGCSSNQGPDAYDSDTDSSAYTEGDLAEPFGGRFSKDFVEQVTLPDGRKVRLWYSKSGTELMEQHYSPDEKAWTAPQTIFASDEPDPCQGIEIVEEDGLVAAIADFALYCYDGEPPMESLAVVGSGDLTAWQVDMTPGFDGWSKVTITDGEIEWSGGDESLTWTDGEFSG